VELRLLCNLEASWTLAPLTRYTLPCHSRV